MFLSCSAVSFLVIMNSLGQILQILPTFTQAIFQLLESQVDMILQPLSLVLRIFHLRQMRIFKAWELPVGEVGMDLKSCDFPDEQKGIRVLNPCYLIYLRLVQLLVPCVFTAKSILSISETCAFGNWVTLFCQV